MSLTVGTDTYISLADAEAYLALQYTTNDPQRVAWNLLSAPNKEILLRRATQVIDRLPLIGFKNRTTQPLEFPRTLYTEVTPPSSASYTGVIYREGYYMQTEVPSEVRFAQCEIALGLMGTGSGGSRRAKLQREGVKQFSLGGLSESYTGGRVLVDSQEAERLLTPYIRGGYRVC